MGWLSDVFESGFADNALNVGLGVAGIEGQKDALREAANRAKQSTQRIADVTAQQSQFKPFTVTSTMGGKSRTTPQGGFNLSVNPTEKAMQSRLLKNARGLFKGLDQGTEAREQDVYERMRALQRPGEQRQRLELENRLQGQGRLGLQTAQYGGAPEQLALQKAIQESRNQAALQAMQQAQRERQQDFQLGSGMFQQAYLPQAQALNLLGAGTNLASIADAGRRQGASLGSEALLSGLDFELQSMLGEANLTGNYLTALSNLNSRAMQNSDGSGGLFSTLWDAGSSLFGGGTGESLDDLLVNTSPRDTNLDLGGSDFTGSFQDFNYFDRYSSRV